MSHLETVHYLAYDANKECYWKYEVDHVAPQVVQLLSQQKPDIERALELLKDSFDIGR